ncbi:hypothetical protein R6Q57_020671 [Mikania cordata]
MGKVLGYKECDTPFNHNYSRLPRIHTTIIDLVLQSDHAFEFPTKPVSLTVDPMFVSDDFELCADSLRENEEERNAGRSTEYSTSSSKSHFVPNTDFVGKFETTKIKPNEMFKSFKATFVKIDDEVIESDSSPLKQGNEMISDTQNFTT